MQFYEYPEISWNEWLYKGLFDDNEVTPLGKYVIQKTHNACFIDIPCGNSSIDSEYSLYDLALKIGINTYYEVDSSRVTLGNRLQSTPRMYNNLKIKTYCCDIVEFIQQWQRPSNCAANIWYISGLQPITEKMEFTEYYQNCLQYISQLFSVLVSITRSNDVVIINDPETLCSGIHENEQMYYDARLVLPAKGFLPSRCCQFGKIHIFIKQ